MKPICILHISDDHLTHRTVKHSLDLDGSFTLKSCTRVDYADQLTINFSPDLFLYDIVDSAMENQDILLRLIKIMAATNIPIIVATTKFGPITTDQLDKLGINGIIFKPYDPFALPELLRSHLRSFRFKAVGYDFDKRLLVDEAALKAFRKRLSEEPDSETISEGLQTCAHKLAGAAGVFNFVALSEKASALEESVIARRTGRGSKMHIKKNLDALLQCIGRQ